MIRQTFAAGFAAALLAAAQPLEACRLALTDPDLCEVARASARLAGASPELRVHGLIRAAMAHAGRSDLQGNPLSAIPPGTRLHNIEVPKRHADDAPDHVTIYLDFPEESGRLTPYHISRIGNEFVHALTEENVSGYFLRIKDPKTGDWLEPDEYAPPEPMPEYVPEFCDATAAQMAARGISTEKADAATREHTRTSPVMNPGQPAGSLSNRTVFLNQSHGWFDDFTWSGNRWRVQRGNTCDTLEDFASSEFMSLYVLPMLRNAGAKVMTVRESDFQTNMVIVDNSDTAVALPNGRYTETGSWANSSLRGFVHKTTAAWVGKTINPFNQGTSQNRLSSNLTAGAPTATATWTANIPASGYYNVYASWSPFSGRALDAQYLVHHSGGISEVRMNQRIDGFTWVLLGNWYFEAGAPENERKVVLTNHSTAGGGAVNVSADAVRWGGGMGDVARHTNGVSGRPRWEEEAVNYLQYIGFGSSGTLYAGDDDEEGGWADRPQYARWEHSQKDASVEDAIYVAWHTNAFNGTAGNCNGTAQGVSSFRHDTATAASQSLQHILHDKLYAAANTLWFTSYTWQVRSKNVTNFGENNQGSLGTGLPGMLLEGLFHDNAGDTEAYNHPQFRYLYARAFVQGVIDYFNTRDATSLPYPPEPPLNFRAIALGGGQVQLTWSAGPSGGFNGAPTTGYKVFTSRNGFGFNDGVVVGGTSHIITGVPENEVRYFRVIATNSGGQSFPTETLVASGGGGSQVLVVNGFDRNETSLVPMQTITNAGTVRRHDPRNFQAFNYAVEHGEALKGRGLRISSSSNEPVEAGTVSLSPYALVVWICGEESTLDKTLTANERSRLETYLNAGGKLFISGAEVGFDIGRAGSSSAAEIAFYNNFLRTSYVADSAGTYIFSGSGGGPYAGLTNISFAPAAGARYNAEFPDRIGTSGGSSVVLTYVGGSGGNAGIGYTGANQVLSFGFPFETIATPANRDLFMTRSLEYFGLTPSGFSNGEWMLY